MRTKAEIRAHFLKKRKDLGETERQRLSRQIDGQTRQYLNENRWIRHIHLFLPIEKLYEINTWFLVQELLNRQKQVYTSVIDFDSNVMRSVRIDKSAIFVKGKFGVPVPANPLYVEDGQQFDLVLVPLLAFDLKGVRVGYGKGYYDRFFKSMKGDVRKIGLSYFPATDLLPREDHDVLLDGCILPDQTIYFTKL